MSIIQDNQRILAGFERIFADYRFVKDTLRRSRNLLGSTKVSSRVFKCPKQTITENYLKDNEGHIKNGSAIGKCGYAKDYRRTYCCSECWNTFFADKDQESKGNNHSSTGDTS